MRSSAGKIHLTGFDDLFSSSPSAEVENGLEKVQEISLDELFPFRNHPFHVVYDEKMQETSESISKYGVLVPGIARPRPEGGYEIIAGHRRKRGSELAGKTTMPVIVREMDDDEATIIMVDSNIQRENLLPSEKAWAYKMKLDALKHQGRRSDLTSAPMEQKLGARDQVAKDAGESSGAAVARYISLTKLLPSLLRLVDEGKISVKVAADYLSSMPEPEQTELLSVMEELHIIPTPGMFSKLKEYSKKGELTRAVIHAVLTEGKSAPAAKVTLKADRIRRYFPESYTQQQMEAVIFELLEKWSEAQHTVGIGR